MPSIKKLATAIVISFAMLHSTFTLAESNNAPSPKPTITTANPEFVYKYLLGEIAGQRGDVSLASQLFLDLAKQTRDARLAERAARAAAYANQPDIASHDLGHTPFGHTGQHALDDCVRATAPASVGFEHNAQSLRVVDHLEECSLAFDGLNLSFETREGILKHCSHRHALALVAQEPGGVAERFLRRTQPSLEAQLCNLADELAYNAHDIDDGMRAGLLCYEALRELPLFERFHREVLAQHPAAQGKRLLGAVIGRMLSQQVDDLIAHSTARIAAHHPLGADDVARAPALIACSDEGAAAVLQLKAHLRQHLYQHPRVAAANDVVRLVVRELFAAYLREPAQMPTSHAVRLPVWAAVTDYIAGMTDRYALREHERLIGGQLARRLPSQLLSF